VPEACHATDFQARCQRRRGQGIDLPRHQRHPRKGEQISYPRASFRGSTTVLSPSGGRPPCRKNGTSAPESRRWPPAPVRTVQTPQRAQSDESHGGVAAAAAQPRPRNPLLDFEMRPRAIGAARAGRPLPASKVFRPGRNRGIVTCRRTPRPGLERESVVQADRLHVRLDLVQAVGPLPTI